MLYLILTKIPKIQIFGDVWELTLCAGVSTTHLNVPHHEVAGITIFSKRLKMHVLSATCRVSPELTFLKDHCVNLKYHTNYRLPYFGLLSHFSLSREAVLLNLLKPTCYVMHQQI